MSGLATAGVVLRLLDLPSTAMRLAQSLPWQAWAALGASASLLLGWHVHGGWERRQFNAAFNAGYQIEWHRRQTDIAAWRRASAEAQARNLADVKRIETDAQTITETQNARIQSDAARYRDLAAAYTRLHAAPQAAGAAAPGGDTRPARLPGAAEAARQPDPTAAGAVVPADDLQRCATLYAVAKGWQDWWAAQELAWPRPPG